MADQHPTAQRPIDAHGIIGDMRSAALVDDQGSIDFFCWPEFDSPSIFCSLLDSPAAGIFELAPVLADARRQQIYLPTATSCRPAGWEPRRWWKSPTC